MAGSVKPGEEYEGMTEDQMVAVLLRDFDLPPARVLTLRQKVTAGERPRFVYENSVYHLGRTHSGYQDIYAIMYDDDGTGKREIGRLHAETERHGLMVQAIRTHRENLEFESIRFQREIEDIERTYTQRLGDE